MQPIEAQKLLDLIDGQLNYHDTWSSSYRLLKDAINNAVLIVNTPLVAELEATKVELATVEAEKEALRVENEELREAPPVKETPLPAEEIIP